MNTRFINASSKQILQLLLKVLLVYFLSRVFFGLYHHQNFSPLSFKSLGLIYGWGLKMDVTIIFISNFFFIAGYFFIFLLHPKKWIQYTLVLFFLIPNSLCIALNLFDTGYFNFTAKRSSIDLLYVFTDSLQSMGSIFNHYWALFICYLFLVYLLAKWIWIFFKRPLPPYKLNLKGLPFNILLLVLVYICFRVDDKKMITSTSPLIDIESKNLALAQNSPFTFLYSFYRRQQQLSVKNFMPAAQAAELYPVIQKISPDSPVNKKNVVIIILESFAKDYLKEHSNGRASTPFIDSLLLKSTYFNNAYSQERSSNKGIVSILGSLPPVTDEPFYHSIYAGAYKQGIGHIFKKNGYSTNFFYGTEYDHFGFKKWMNAIGVEHYFCRDDFDDPAFYDGSLGLYDDPWLQFMAGKLNKLDTPFLSIVFTISTHWPYKVPPDFLKRKDIEGEGLAQKSASYADYALGNFFNAIKHQAWFKNSIFIFCADHWFSPNKDIVDDITRGYEIPIFVYEPSKSIGASINTLASQLDILPTIYSMTGLKQNFTSFGKNLFDTGGKRFAMNYLYQSGLFQIFDNEYILGFDINTDEAKYLFNYKTDSLRKDNLLLNKLYGSKRKELEIQIQAMLQQFNNSVLQNKLTN